MEENRKLALVVSYYLSKFDKKALENLGYSSFTQAFNNIGRVLNVPPNTIKNMRENFDPLHPNGRVGWYQRELTPSRLDVVEKYSELSELAMTEIVKEILGSFKEGDSSLQQYTKIIQTSEKESDNIENAKIYTTRGITGHRAEELFIEAFCNGEIAGFSGTLIDKRNDGCGYDFELHSEECDYAFEVKGLLDEKGGINFTDKEWKVAKKWGDKYIVVLVSSIKTKPKFSMYKNPYTYFDSKKTVYQTIAVNWTVSSNQLF